MNYLKTVFTTLSLVLSFSMIAMKNSKEISNEKKCYQIDLLLDVFSPEEINSLIESFPFSIEEIKEFDKELDKEINNVGKIKNERAIKRFEPATVFKALMKIYETIALKKKAKIECLLCNNTCHYRNNIISHTLRHFNKKDRLTYTIQDYHTVQLNDIGEKLFNKYKNQKKNN